MRQAGALRVTTLEESSTWAHALVSGRTPPGHRVILVTNGGGLGILATDAASNAGLDVAALPAPVQARLAAVLPSHAATTNPVDLIGDATPRAMATRAHALAGESASVVVMLAPQAATDAAGVARAVLGATRDWRVPLLGVFAGGARVRPGVIALEEAGVPCYPFLERAVRALAHTVTLAQAAAACLRTQRPWTAWTLRGWPRRSPEQAAAQRLGLLEGAPLPRGVRPRRRANAARPFAVRGRRGRRESSACRWRSRSSHPTSRTQDRRRRGVVLALASL